jgi:hypothetical protein
MYPITTCIVGPFQIDFFEDHSKKTKGSHNKWFEIVMKDAPDFKVWGSLSTEEELKELDGLIKSLKDIRSKLT